MENQKYKTINPPEECKKQRRYSGLKYKNSKEKLNQIREKYKNGVSKKIIEKMVNELF